MSARLDTERMGNTAGMGFYKDKDGNLKRGANIPDAMWMRLKKFQFIGCATMGDGGSEVEAIRSLIIQNRSLGDEEIVTWLEGKLEETLANMAAAEKAAAAAPELVKTEEDKRLGAFASKIVEAIDDRTAKRRQTAAAPAST